MTFNTRPVSSSIKLAAATALVLALCQTPGLAGQRHMASNLKGDFETARQDGFDLADVASIAVLESLPDGMKGVFWLGNGYNTECAWRLSDDEVVKQVSALAGHPKFSGIYYISDEPHPAKCPDAAARVAERSELIRSTDTAARTFIIVQNSSADRTEFATLKDSADYIGVAPYPCNVKNATTGCDMKALTQRIDEAIAAGITPDRIVPVFQLFGQECATTETPYYRMPRGDELERMLEIWDQRVPPPVRPFAMAYSWGVQERTACPALSQADGTNYPDLREIFSAYMAGRVARLKTE